MIVFVFFLTVLTVFVVQTYFRRKFFYKFAENIPSPPSFGFLGHAPYFLGKDEQGQYNFVFNKNFCKRIVIKTVIKLLTCRTWCEYDKTNLKYYLWRYKKAL